MADHVDLCDDKVEDNGKENYDENEEESEDGANKLVSKPNAKSVVWYYFSIKAGEDGAPLHDEMDKPICSQCKKNCSGNTL